MEYRLIRHRVTGERLVIAGDGYVSTPLGAAISLATDPARRVEWWRVARPERNTALWAHPLWQLEARHRTRGDRAGAPAGRAPAPPPFDVVQEASEESFPASDAPAWTQREPEAFRGV